MRSGSWSPFSILPLPAAARSNERFRKDDAAATGPRVVVDLLLLPVEGDVESDGALVPGGGNRLHLNAVGRSAALGEPLVEQPPDAAAAEVRVDSHEVNVPGAGSRRPGRRGGVESVHEEPQQEANHLRVLFHHERRTPELVEENRMDERSDGAAPPVIDDLDDAVEVAFRDSA